MKLTVQIDDDAYEALLAKYGSRQKLDGALKRALAVVTEVEPGDRYFLVAGEARREIEAIVQTTVESAKDIARHLKNMAAVKIGSVERVFTADELIRLQDQARFHGWPPEKFLALTSDEAIRYVMDRI